MPEPTAREALEAFAAELARQQYANGEFSRGLARAAQLARERAAVIASSGGEAGAVQPDGGTAAPASVGLSASRPGSLLDELEEAERVMSQCGAPHDTCDLTGLACTLPDDHPGAHEGWVSVTWQEQP